MATLNVPYCPQETDDTCAPACLRMALGYRFPDKAVSEAEIAKRCRCVPGKGCWVRDVFRAARRCKLNPIWLQDADIETEVRAALDGGCPVVANVQLRVLPYYLPYQRGEQPLMWHSVLVIGMDDQHVYLHDPDPSRGGAHRSVRRADFFSGWTRYHYSAYRV